ncbi:MAG: T9SS type A sorting domain-containing protein [Flavobacteriales bacterium]|nr:T9SS type A sorting domain-containing protein [Flavobacteriales bacterium]
MKQLYVFATFLLSMTLTAQDCTVIDFTMTTENWGQEISWNIADEFGNVVYENNVQYTSYSSFTETTCIYDGCYTLNMFDSFGDGWNGAILNAQYNGLSLAFQLSQGEFGQAAFPINVTDSCDVVTTDVYGCTDPSASNYNPFATIDDGSCYYQNDSIAGCTDPAALNYNPWASIDDGSCVYPVECADNEVLANAYVCVFSNGMDVGFEITDDQGNVVYSQQGYNNFAIDNFDLCLELGVCYTAHLTNLSGPFGWYNGYFWINSGGAQILTGTLVDGQAQMSIDFSVDGTCGDILGCTDPNAANYNANATIDDGSCVYAPANDLCADAIPLQEGTILIDNTGALQNEGVWGDCWSFGSGEGEQSSLWFSFTTPPDTARIIIEAIGDGTYTLTDTQFGLFEECGGEMIACDGNSGEGLLSKFDFQCGELEPNTEYILIVDGYYGDAGTCFLSYTVTSECSDPVYGCTDPSALNYNPDANVDDGSCYYQTDSCATNNLLISFVAGSWANEVSFEVVSNGTLLFSSNGFQFENQGQYFFTVCIPDGCYTLNMYDSFGDGWNGGEIYLNVDGTWIAEGITIEQGEFGSYTFGINDPDCGSGTGDVYGCTDPLALNYNPQATIDDGTCYYDSTNTFCNAYFQVLSIDPENDVVYIENLSTSGPNAYYFWDFGDGGYSYDENPTYQYAEGGDYIVCLTVYDGVFCASTYCDTISYDPGGFTDGWGEEAPNGNPVGWWINVVPPNSTGIEDVNGLDDFQLYPVPTTDLLTVRLNSALDQDIQIDITDLRGRLVERLAFDKTGVNEIIEINTSDLEAGSYLIELTGTEGRVTKRFEVIR